MSALTNRAHTPTQNHSESITRMIAYRECDCSGGGFSELPGILAVIITTYTPMNTLKSLLAIVLATLIGLASALTYLALIHLPKI